MQAFKFIARAIHEADAVDSPDLENVRRIASAGFLIYLWGMTIFVSVLAYGWSPQWVAVSTIAFVLAIVASTAWKNAPSALNTRLTIGACMTGNWMMLLYASTGYGDGEFILDAHMIFFVINGLFLAYFCWRTIFFSTCMTLVHHIALHFLAPLMIWPSNSYAEIHIINHLLLAMFTGPGGMVISVAICRLFGKAETAIQQHLAEKEEAQKLLKVVSRQKADGQHVVAILADALQDLSEGAPDVTIKDPFPGVYEKLREDFNLAAERLEMTKSNFVSTVSHELRTPLTSIRGAVGMMLGASDTQRSDVELRLLDITANNCERLMKLINDLLDVDRLTQGHVKVEFGRHETGTLCQSTVKSLEPYASNLGVSVQYVPNVEKMFSYTDASQFVQVLTNLVSNAVKFSEKGSTVTVRSQIQDGDICVSVVDSGPGISDAFAPHLFERFRQADGSASRTYAGSGVGLYICKSIIAQLGGDIGFRNNVDGGATFWFTVPMMGETHKPRLQADQEDFAQQKLPNILHVEDDTNFAEIFGLACQSRANILHANSYQEAVTILDNHHVDLVLIDWELPDGSGVDILSHPKVSGSTVPVVSLSSSSDTPRPSRTLIDIVKTDMQLEKVANIIFTILADQARSKETLDDLRRIVY